MAEAHRLGQRRGRSRDLTRSTWEGEPGRVACARASASSSAQSPDGDGCSHADRPAMGHPSIVPVTAAAPIEPGTVLDEPLVPPPDRGRVFRAGRRVRLADADPTGRCGSTPAPATCRTSATTTPPTAASTTTPSRPGWCAGPWSTCTGRPAGASGSTWPPGAGAWAAAGPSAACRWWASAAAGSSCRTLWVHVDGDHGARPLTPAVPRRLRRGGGRPQVSSRLWLGDPPVGAAAEPWPLRAVDIDLLGHVNNAAYWAAVEEQIEPGIAFAHAPAGPAPPGGHGVRPGHRAPATRSSCWSTRPTSTCRCGSRSAARCRRRPPWCRCPLRSRGTRVRRQPARVAGAARPVVAVSCG